MIKDQQIKTDRLLLAAAPIGGLIIFLVTYFLSELIDKLTL